MADSSSSSSGGIGFTGLLTIVFIVLKLIGKIDWSWWWVLSPLWIVAVLVVALLLVVFAFGLILELRLMDLRREGGGNRRNYGLSLAWGFLVASVLGAIALWRV